MSARIVASARPLLLTFKCLGIFGCALESNRLAPGKAFSRLYSLAWIILSCRISGMDESLRKFDISRPETMTKVIRELVMFVAITSDSLVAIFQQKNIIRVFDKIDDYDRRLIDLGLVRNDRCLVYWTILGLPIIIYLEEKFHAFYQQYYHSLDQAEITSLMDFGDTGKTYYVSTLHYVIVVKLTILVDLIYRRFCYLNVHVTPRIDTCNDIVYRHGSISVHEVRYMHAKLCESAEILMSVYGPWLILWFLVMTHAISSSLLASPPKRFFPYTGLTGMWLVGLCVSCGLASDEANKIARRLIEQRSFSGDATETMERIEMALYLCNHELRFSAMRIYTINRQFLLSILSMMLSYMTFISATN